MLFLPPLVIPLPLLKCHLFSKAKPEVLLITYNPQLQACMCTHTCRHIHIPHTLPYSCSPFSFINGPRHLLSQVCSIPLKTVSGGRACQYVCWWTWPSLEPGPGTKRAWSVCWGNLLNVRSQFNFPSFIIITPKINSDSEVTPEENDLWPVKVLTFCTNEQ